MRGRRELHSGQALSLMGAPPAPAVQSPAYRPPAATSSRGRAALDHPAGVEHEDLVDGVQPGQPVGDRAAVVRPAVTASRSAVSASAVATSRCSPARRGPAPGSRRAARGPAPAAAAGRRRAGPVLARLGWPGRRAARRPTSSRRTRARTARSSSVVASGRPSRRFSSRVVSKTWASCATRPTTRRTSSPAQRGRARRRRA